MLFSSIIFLFYFLPVVLVLYYGTFWSRRLQNTLLLLVSLFFYGWGEPKYVFLMIGSIVFNYVMGMLIHRYQKRFLLVLTIVGNLGVLFVFKYLSFFVRNLNAATDYRYQLSVPNIVLPIGISFFTFQAMSYVIDVYRKNVKVQKNPFYLGLYVSFFPQLIAGPIVRYAAIEEQIMNRKETWQKFSAGSCRFIMGLSKKVLISNNMAVIADRIFTMQGQQHIPVSLAWLGAIAYTLQIYYDFSGYSDMAIGLGLMFGFKFEENFNYPYISRSIGEFWRRWHISLGTWFKEYVYFPLGGSRGANKDKMVRNMLVVWALTGIWHGAEWTFVFWGLFNFVFLMLERLLDFESSDIPSVIKHVYCMLLVTLGWVLFRSTDLIQAGRYIADMFGFGKEGLSSQYTWMFIRENIVFLMAGIIFSMPIAQKTNAYIYKQKSRYQVLEACYPFAVIALFIISISYLVKGTYNPFIYFNF
ncbi:MAG TPA: membrane-bound O-acyltransferase family protein [Lachnospiraceae bacterium]|nr:membrane-bound O-acyltransferase family protein [Lachnospiraceae bacterium]